MKCNILFILLFLYAFLLINCGRVKRVIGGLEVKCGTQPNVASLRNATSLQHKCGATIISPHFALTAAHCVKSKEDEYILHLNNHCAGNYEAITKATLVQIIKHDLYDPVTRAHDLALIRITLPDDITWLKQNVEDSSMQNILPTSSFGISGECTIYGYGYDDLYKMETSDKLLSGSLRIVSLDECKKALDVSVAPDYDDGMICAVGDGIDSCQGDSGSPLMCAGGTIEGISSYGISCAVPGLPGVYTSIGAHLQWIRYIIKDDQF